jgi:glutamate carboxypeptidase
MSLDAVVRWCATRREPMLALLEELCVINSFSNNPIGGARVAEVLARELRALGLDVTLHPGQRFGPHVSATTEAARADATGCIALVGHLDTVFPPDTFEGFTVDGELAYGPGVVDMKGGLVVMLNALAAFAEHGTLAQIPARVVIVSDEEVGSPEGAAVIEKELPGAGCALVFETGRPNDLIVTSRKGTGGVRAIATGKAAHAGNNHQAGANAVWAIARLVDLAQQLTDYDRGRTVSTGIVKGGHSRNTVPDRAEALFDLRFIREADGDEMVRQLERAAETACVPGTSIELSGGLARPPLERTDANVALYRAYAECARAAGLGSDEAPLQGGGSDAATTGALGIPSIDGLGPRGTGFHTHDECMEIATLVPKLEATVRFVWAHCKLGP